MKENKELKIAIIVGVIMITVCLLALIFVKAERNSNNSNQNQIDIKVYKVNEEEKIYEPCHINTDMLIKINSEFKRAYRLTESSRVKGKTIKGEYKVMSGNEYVAFDVNEEEQYIYRGDTKYLYEFDSDLYNVVEKACQ